MTSVRQLHRRDLPTPLGTVRVLALNGRVVRVVLPAEDHDAREQNAVDALDVKRVVDGDHDAVLDAVATKLDRYFAQSRSRLDVPVDLQLVGGEFRLRVLAGIREIPAGETRTYGQLSTGNGRPRSWRAVGSACAKNPVPLLIPCHRVVRTGGVIGAYLGGTEAKEWLLRHEGARIAS